MFIGNFIKKWGQEGELGFFWRQSFHPILVIFDKKELGNQKISFPKIKF